jgi:two-component system, chemotaxis family, protein-glutamate methylesterase/glutaminase
MRGEGKKYEVIVIGTSAGGLQAISFLFEKLPQAYALPIVVVQHRGKDHTELLEEVMQNKCSLVIQQADEKEALKPGHAYFAPPDYHLLLERNLTFSLSSEALVCYSRPSIDVLFESAALAFGKRVVGILLTGANSDGAAGMKMLHEYGAFTIAQDPGEALHATMPQAAIAAKAAAQVWTLGQIQKFLMEIGHV